jgi:hypothetical protein
MPAAGPAAAQQPLDDAGSPASLPMELDDWEVDLVDDTIFSGSESDLDGGNTGIAAFPQQPPAMGSGLPPTAFRQHASCPLVWVSSDRRGSVFAYSFRSSQQRKLRWAFIGLQLVQFADGTLLVGWCKDCQCSGSANRLHDLLEGLDQPEQEWAAWFGDLPPLCPCSEQLLHSLRGRDRWQQLVSAANAALVSSGGSMVTELPQQGMRAVHTGSSFDSWAVVDANSRCCSCASNNYHCCHAQLVSPAAASAASGPVAAEWSSWDANSKRMWTTTVASGAATVCPAARCQRTCATTLHC